MEMNPVDLLKELVRIDTTNPPGRELPLLERLAALLRDAGVECVLQETAPGRGNIAACLPAEAPLAPPLFLLSHIDVVPAQAEQWRHPPFAAEEEDGYIYGRGTVDTKHLTVMELAAFLDLKARGAALKRDVIFLATCDEEAGSEYGIRWFLDHPVTLNGREKTGREWFADSDVISEGGGFPILAADKEYYLCEAGQKTCGTVEFTVKARQARGIYLTSGDGMARAMGLAEAIGSLRLEGRELQAVRRFEECLAGTELSPMMANILRAMKHNTMTVTMITGRNINEVHLTCDVRLLPGFGRAYLEDLLRRLCGEWGCEAKILSLHEGFESDPEGAFLQILEEATLSVLGKSRAETELLPFVSMGGSDGRFLVGTGARVYGYSPVYSWDMTFDSAVQMVHGIDERIHRDSVLFGSRVLTQAVRKAAEKE